MAYLIVERGNDSNSRFEITISPSIVGRDSSSDIILADEEISRHHCQIKNRGRSFIIRDLGSRNGTYVNGDKIVNSILKTGDKLLLGSTELTFINSESEINITYSKESYEIHQHEEVHPEGLSYKPIEGKPVRFDPYKLLNDSTLPTHALTKISNLVRDLLVITDLGEFSRFLLKAVSKIAPHGQEFGFYIWQDTSGSLVPMSQKGPTPKLIYNKMTFLKDAISRKSGIMSSLEDQIQEAAIPMLNHNSLLGVTYLRFKKGYRLTPAINRDLCHLLSGISASLETLILRRSMQNWMAGAIETLIAVVEAKDTYTRGHSERVCKYAMAIADQMKLDKETKKMLMVSSLCHDIGKVGIPDSILKKAAVLSIEEYEEMKLHPSLGASIIANMPNYNKFIGGVKYHHEKWDGSGYPDGLVGEDIPFFGRVIAITDVFDAMISGRAYSGFIDQEVAIDKLKKEADLFDPHIFDMFVKAYESGRLSTKTSTHSNNLDE